MRLYHTDNLWVPYNTNAPDVSTISAFVLVSLSGSVALAKEGAVSSDSRYDDLTGYLGSMGGLDDYGWTPAQLRL
jgi:hypothetical protein